MLLDAPGVFGGSTILSRDSFGRCGRERSEAVVLALLGPASICSVTIALIAARVREVFSCSLSVTASTTGWMSMAT